MLYDVTSNVEGRNCSAWPLFITAEREKACFGLLWKNGCPVAVAGLTGDPTTVGAQVEKIQNGLESIMPVGDRGMITFALIREDMPPAVLGGYRTLKTDIRKLETEG